MEHEFWNKRREHLQDAVKKAVLELSEHTLAASFSLPIEGGSRRIEVKITSISATAEHSK